MQSRLAHLSESRSLQCMERAAGDDLARASRPADFQSLSVKAGSQINRERKRRWRGQAMGGIGASLGRGRTRRGPSRSDKPRGARAMAQESSLALSRPVDCSNAEGAGEPGGGPFRQQQACVAQDSRGVGERCAQLRATPSGEPSPDRARSGSREVRAQQASLSPLVLVSTPFDARLSCPSCARSSDG